MAAGDWSDETITIWLCDISIGFMRFVSREHYLSKIGYPSGSGISGVASLWRMTRDEKEREGYMFSGLRLVRNCAAEDIPEVEFILPGNTPSPDFRLGDIVLFYVCDTDADRVSNPTSFQGDDRFYDGRPCRVEITG